MADVQQAELAHALGVSRAHVSMMLRGHRTMPADRRHRLVALLVDRIASRSADDPQVAS